MELSVKVVYKAKGRVLLHGQKAQAFGQNYTWAIARDLGNSVPAGDSLTAIILSVVSKQWEDHSGRTGPRKARFLWMHELDLVVWWVHAHCMHTVTIHYVNTPMWLGYAELWNSGRKERFNSQTTSPCSSLVSPASHSTSIALQL